MFSFFIERAPTVPRPEDDSWQGGYTGFSEKEMGCRGRDCGCGGLWLPRHSFMTKLVLIRGSCGFPIFVTSGGRCPVYDMGVRGDGTTGSHEKKLAVDIWVHGSRAIQLMATAYYYGMTGFGVSQKGDRKKRFIHLDSMGYWQENPNIRVWSY